MTMHVSCDNKYQRDDATHAVLQITTILNF